MDGAKKNKLLIGVAGTVLLGLFVWCLLKPADSYSASERRTLKSMPAFTVEGVASGKFMENFETYATDQFPLRDVFRSGKVWFARYVLGQKDQNKVYKAGKHLSKLEYPLDEKSLDNAACQFEELYRYYVKQRGGAGYLAIVPDKNMFLAKKNGYPQLDYDTLFQTMQDKTQDLTYIDLVPYLEAEDYYFTDPHWRQEKITDVADHILESMGCLQAASAQQEETVKATFTVPVWQKKQADTPFYGVYAGQYGLKTEGETLYYLETSAFDGCRVTDLESNKTIPVYDTERTDGRDPYEMFLSGSKSLIQIDNPAGPAGKRLLLFRDSFGSSIAPLLIPYYEQIVLIDIRYIKGDVLERFVNFENADALFLYSTLVLNNSITMQGNLHHK